MMKFCCLALLLLVSPTLCNLTEQQKKDILDLHNENRRLLNGEDFSPAAANMKKLVWSDALAQVAQAFSDSCVPWGHSNSTDRKNAFYAYGGSRDYTSVGENLAYGHFTPLESVADWWYELIWAIGSDPLHPGYFDLGAGHYSQMAWATTELIGCGYRKESCSNGAGQPRHLTCNYANGGNIIGRRGMLPPYVAGERCSECPLTHPVCDNGLCSSDLCFDKPPCRAQDQCHNAGVCDRSTGECTNPTKSNFPETQCDDGNPNTSGDVCVDGVCTGSCALDSDCEASLGCQIGACVRGECVYTDNCPASTLQCRGAGVCGRAGVCEYSFAEPGTFCDDGNASTYSEACDRVGECRGYCNVEVRSAPCCLNGIFEFIGIKNDRPYYQFDEFELFWQDYYEQWFISDIGEEWSFYARSPENVPDAPSIPYLLWAWGTSDQTEGPQYAC